MARARVAFHERDGGLRLNGVPGPDSMRQSGDLIAAGQIQWNTGLEAASLNLVSKVKALYSDHIE